MSFLYCFPSCTTASCLDYFRLWVSHESLRLTRLDCPKIPFRRHSCFEDTHASYLPLCHAHGFLPIIDCIALQSLVHDLISLIGPCVSLGFHWSLSNVLSSFMKACRVSTANPCLSNSSGGLTKHVFWEGSMEVI